MSPKEIAWLALAVLGFPAYWPLVVARNAALGARYRALGARRDDQSAARVAEAKRAVVHLRTTYTMASGPETEGLVVLELGEGTLVAPDSQALRAALAEAKVPLTTVESEEAGIGGAMAWTVWALLALVAAVSWQTEWVPVALATSAGLGAVAFAFRPRNTS